MIGVEVRYDGNFLRMSLPTDELFDHLGSIGVDENIPIGGTDDIKVEIYDDEDSPVARTVCERVFPNDKISAVNKLCDQIESAWRVRSYDINQAFIEQDLRGAEAMSEVVVQMDNQSHEKAEQGYEMKM